MVNIQAVTAFQDSSKSNVTKESLKDVLNLGFSFLVFPRQLEHLYQKDYLQHHLPVGRWYAIFGILVFICASAFDQILFPEQAKQTCWIRILTGSAISILIYLTTRPRFIRWSQLSFCVGIYAVSLSLTAIGILVSEGGNFYYLDNVLICMLFAAIGLRLMFWYALITMILMYISYGIAIVTYADLPTTILFNNLLILMMACTLGLVGNYQLELSKRRNYLLQLLSDEEHSDAEKTKEELVRNSYIDSVTELHNRRYLEQQLSKEWSMAVRHNHAVGLILFDIDHFRRFKENLGHDDCNKVLMRISQLLLTMAGRPHDVVARLGSDSFALLLPNIPLDVAHQKAESIRSQINDWQVIANNSTLSISAGIAVIRPDAEGSAQKLIDMADAALFQAKESGRNQVFHHELVS